MSKHLHYNTQKRWTSKDFVVIEYPIEEDTLSRLAYLKMTRYHFDMQAYARVAGELCENYRDKKIYMLVYNIDGKDITVDSKISRYGIKYKWVPFIDPTPPPHIEFTNDADEAGQTYYPDFLVVPPQNKAKFRPNSSSISLLYWRKKLTLQKIPEAECEFRKLRFFASSFRKEVQQKIWKNNASSVKELKTSERELKKLNPISGKAYRYVLVKINFSVFCKNHEDEFGKVG